MLAEKASACMEVYEEQLLMMSVVPCLRTKMTVQLLSACIVLKR